MEASDWRSASMKDKAKLAHGKFKEKCTDKVLKIANYVCIGVLAFGVIMNLVFLFSGGEKPPNYSGFWFFFSTLYYAFFLALLALSLHPDQEN